jgi:putative hydrolase of the HAD superfamily
MDIDKVIFDFGGVLAENGFEEGFSAIAAKHGLDEKYLQNLAYNLIYSSGYLTGRIEEHVYWQAIRDKTGIRDEDTLLRNEILSRFVLRAWMIDVVKKLKAKGIGVAILSDQTNWLDELNERDDFFRHFDAVFNSYHIKKSKMDPSHFSDTISRLNCVPRRLLFIDDTVEHCATARKMLMKAIHFIDRDSFMRDIVHFVCNRHQED